MSPVICRCPSVRSPSPLAAAARPCCRRNTAATTSRRATRGVLPRLERLAGGRGEAARPRPTDKAAPLHLSNARRGRDPAARQGPDRRQSRSRPRRHGRPVGGPRGDGPAATKIAAAAAMAVGFGKLAHKSGRQGSRKGWPKAGPLGDRRGGPRSQGTSERTAEGSAGRSVPCRHGGPKRDRDGRRSHHLLTVRSPIIFDRRK